MYQKRMPFPQEEFRERLTRVQESMREKKLDLLLIHTPENIFYLTCHHSAGYFMYMCLVVHVTESPVLVLRYGEIGNALIYSFLDEKQICCDDDIEDPVEKTAKVIAQFPLADGNIGIEVRSWFFSIANYKRLSKRLAKGELVDTAGIVEQLRIVKSPAELAYIRQACRAVDAGMEAAVHAIGRGVNEDCVAASLYGAIVSHGCQHLGMEPFVAKGWKSGLMHNVWSSEPIQEGDCILLEVPAAINRYHGILMRTVYVGDPPTMIREWSAICIEALNEAIKAIRPGVTSGEVDEACRGVIERAGLYEYFRKRTGYAMGCAFAPDWGEGHIASLQKDDPLVLKEGMVFHVPPAIRMRGEFGVGFSESIIVTKNGCEVVTHFPRKLILR